MLLKTACAIRVLGMSCGCGGGSCCVIHIGIATAVTIPLIISTHPKLLKVVIDGEVGIDEDGILSDFERDVCCR